MKTADDFLKDMETDENLMAKFTEVFDKTDVESEQARIDLIVQFAVLCLPFAVLRLSFAVCHKIC